MIVICLPLPRASALALAMKITLPLLPHTTANNSERRRQCIVTHSGRSYPWPPRIRSSAVSDMTMGPPLVATAVGARRGRRRGPRRAPTPPRTLPDLQTGRYCWPTTSAGRRGDDRAAYGGRFGSIGGAGVMVERLAERRATLFVLRVGDRGLGLVLEDTFRAQTDFRAKIPFLF